MILCADQSHPGHGQRQADIMTNEEVCHHLQSPHLSNALRSDCIRIHLMVVTAMKSSLFNLLISFTFLTLYDIIPTFQGHDQKKYRTGNGNWSFHCWVTRPHALTEAGN